MTFIIPEKHIRNKAAGDGVTHFSTGIAIVKDDKVLVVRRVPHDHLGGVWELPGGGVDPGETFEESAIREAFEETGLKVSQITNMIEGFDYQTPRKSKVRQVNLIVDVEPGDVMLEPEEHDEFRWIGAEDIDSLELTGEIRTCLQLILT